MTIPLNNTATIQVSASTDQLAIIRSFVRENVERAGFSDFEENNIVLAVDEACANLIQHAYHDDSSYSINIRIILEGQLIRVEISDTAAPFDPGKAPLPDMQQYFAENRHHGLGILLMTRVMDKIEYHASENGGRMNTLILTKYRTL